MLWELKPKLKLKNKNKIVYDINKIDILFYIPKKYKMNSEVWIFSSNTDIKGVYSSFDNCKQAIKSYIICHNRKLKEEYRLALQEDFNKKVVNGTFFDSIYKGDKDIFSEFQYDEKRFQETHGDKYIDMSKISVKTEKNLTDFIYQNQTLFSIKKIIMDENIDSKIEPQKVNCICGGTGIITKKVKYGFSGKFTESKEKCTNCNANIDKRKLPVWTNSKGERVKSFENPGEDFIRGLFHPINKKRKISELDDEYSEDIVPDLKPISTSIDFQRKDIPLVDFQRKDVSSLILSPNLNKQDTLKMLANVALEK